MGIKTNSFIYCSWAFTEYLEDMDGSTTAQLNLTCPSAVPGREEHGGRVKHEMVQNTDINC